MKRFTRDTQGNAALVTALVAVPLVALGGGALDYLGASSAKAKLQALADQAALNAAVRGPAEGGDAELAIARTDAAALGLSDVTIEGEWLSPVDFEVRSVGTAPAVFLQVMPGLPDSLPVKITAVARRTEPRYVYKPPKIATLDPEANDYNELSAYCFDPSRKHEADKGRTQMTAFADNGGSTYDITLPQCEPGQYLSYRLHNVRNARKHPHKWKDKAGEQYTYFTDTVIAGGVEQYDLDGQPILETVVCGTVASCVPKTKGGEIPAGKNRTPQRATKACKPGRAMYYGWEDRPRGRGSSDNDFDDIRVVIECPEMEQVTRQNVRLIR